MIRITKTIVKNGVDKSYSMLCDESQVDILLKDSRYTLDQSQEQAESKEETTDNDTSSNKKRKR